MPTNSIIDEQIKSFRSLFSGRDDAYGLETLQGPISVREKLTDILFEDHLQGIKRVGLYPILSDNTSRWACVDIDSPEKTTPEKIIVACIENNIFPYTEISKSRGFHVWIFFDEPLPANDIRRALLYILKKNNISGVEVFPKQAVVASSNGLGNYVFLPLHGESVKQGKTVFLSTQFRPYEDQWEHLSKIHRTKSENILSLVTCTEDPPVDNHKGKLDVPKYLSHYGIKYKIKHDPDRAFYLLDQCLFSGNHTTPDSKGDSSIIQGSDGKLGYQCFHHHCSDKAWADARRAISGDDPIFRFFDDYVDKGEGKYRTYKRGEGRTLSQILNEPETYDRYLTKPILSRGDKGFVVSSYKMGKTLFLTQWTLALSTGLSFLNMEIPEPQKVLYIRFELKEHRFQKRLRLMIDALGGVERVKVEPVFELVRGFNITSEKDFDWLLGLIKKYRPDCLMLDPLYKMASFDLKDTANAMPLIRRFDSIMEINPDLAIVIAHHLRKQMGDERDSWDQTYGPMFFFADMDFEIRLKADHRKDSIFKFDHISNDVPVESFRFKRNPETLIYYVVNPETDHLDEILDHIQTYKGNKTALKDWMLETFGFSRREAIAIIDRLVSENKIRWEGNKTRGNLVMVEDADSYQTTGK